MPVEHRVEPSDPFDILQWTGGNLAEMAEFAQQELQVTCGLIGVDTGEDGLFVIPVGWWVRRDADGTLSVASRRVAARWLTPSVA